MSSGAGRRFLRALVAASLALASVWLGVVLVERFAAPPSTLILGRRLFGDPVDQRWRALPAISPHLARAVIASEDQRFCRHHGVDWGALAEVLDREGGPSRGASTITMQTVKNLYLWPGRSWLRKALELPMAVVLDALWPKKRVMEVYLNVAEWGEGIFGAEAAAQRHFGKPARELSAAEAARLAAALPNPRLSDPRHPSGASRRIARRMGEIGGLADCLD